MKLFNNHSGSRGPPRFVKGIYWEAGSFLRTSFTEGCAGASVRFSSGANETASPPGRQQRCTFSPTMRSVQYDARVYLVWTSMGIIFFLRSLCSKFSSVAVKEPPAPAVVRRGTLFCASCAVCTDSE